MPLFEDFRNHSGDSSICQQLLEPSDNKHHFFISKFDINVTRFGNLSAPVFAVQYFCRALKKTATAILLLQPLSYAFTNSPRKIILTPLDFLLGFIKLLEFYSLVSETPVDFMNL